MISKHILQAIVQKKNKASVHTVTEHLACCMMPMERLDGGSASRHPTKIRVFT